MTPAADECEHESWLWDDDDDRPPLPSSPRRSPTVGSHSSSSYQSSFSSGGGRSRSASVLATPLTPPASVEVDSGDREGTRPRISPLGKIPRAALFPWTPAQRAVRLQRVSAKRSVPPPPLPPPVSEEEQEIPLTLVDSRYVPGVGHVNVPHRAHTTPPASPIAESSATTTATKKKGRFRSHTVPVPACVRSTLATEEAEPGVEHEEHEQPQSPSCKHSLRQSVYWFGLKTKLGLHYIKVRLRSASSAARRP
ncbi:hypothetical protein FRC12_018960 [Ceratobasidium sp. 428]|nr:hypothetical protein FRC12_018960 [Ceratobasidium sp. 428]